MDLSALSDADLYALKAGDLSKVSDQGLKHLRRQSIAAKIDADPISQGARNFASEGSNFAASYGKAGVDLFRGVGQLLGINDQASIDEAKRLDAPMMKTRSGLAGNILGNVALAVPTVAAGPTLAAAGATGAGMGFLQPVASDDSRLKNTAVGGVAGVGGALLGRGIAAGYQGIKALAEPFTQGGRERIAGRMIARFADDPSKIAATTSAPTVTGARPTLAEQTGDVGLARLQDSLRAADPQFNNQITSRLAENSESRVNSLLNLAGPPSRREAADAAREAAAKQLYGSAFAADGALTPSQLLAQKRLIENGGIDKLIQSPAIQAAMKEAQTNALNAGKKMTPDGSIEGLHNMKLAIDDMIKDPTTAAQSTKVASLKAARDRLVSVIETLSPDYRAARATYAEMSRPINAIDVAAEVAKKGLSKGTDLSGNQTINRNALLGALQDEKSLIRGATGRKSAGNALSDVMEPDQLNLLRAIASESDRAGAVATAGNGPGSATAQRMAAQNVLRQVIGPTGLPQSWADNVLANTVVGKPLNLIYGGIAEPKIQQELARAILDPDAARSVISAAQAQGIKLPPTVIRQLLLSADRAAPVGSAIGWQRSE